MNKNLVASLVGCAAFAVTGLAHAAVPSCSTNGYSTGVLSGGSYVSAIKTDHPAPCALNADNLFNHTARTASDLSKPGDDDGATSYITLSNTSTATFFDHVLVDLGGTDANGNVYGLTASRVDPANAGNYWVSNHLSAEESSNLAFFNNNASGLPGAGSLLVFFPGCGGRPADYTHFLLHAAAQGYHVIGLSYFNPCGGQLSDPDFRVNLDGTAASGTTYATLQETPYDCQTTPLSWNPPYSAADPQLLGPYGSPSEDECISQRMANIVAGGAMGSPYGNTAAMPYSWECPSGDAATVGANDFISCEDPGFNLVTPITYGAQFGATHLPDQTVNSVEARLTKLLTYLRTSFPEQGWDQFCSDGACSADQSWSVEWGSVALAAHSAGTNVATYLASQEPVERVLLFSGPAMFVANITSSCTSNPNNVGCSQESPYGAPSLPGEHVVPSSDIYAFCSYFDATAGYVAELANAGLGAPSTWYGDKSAGALSQNTSIPSGANVGLGLYSYTYCKSGQSNGVGCSACADDQGVRTTCENDVYNGGNPPNSPSATQRPEHFLVDTGGPEDYVSGSNSYNGNGHNFIIADGADVTYAANGKSFYGNVWNYMLTNCMPNATCY